MTALKWERDGLDWPNRATSRFVSAGGLRWHVQEMGSGPTVLLLHGTGASTHSWRHFMPILAKRFRVIAPDLPGHGFTEAPRTSSLLTLPHMAQAIATLLGTLHVKPDLAIGHSAGSAILCRMALDGKLGAQAIISLNGAFLPFPGIASQLFPMIARALFVNPFVPGYFAWKARDKVTVRRLIEGTGSHIDAEGLVQYGLLLGNSTHIASALGMMANWDLQSLSSDLPKLKTKLTLIACTEDKAVPSQVAFKVYNMVPGSKVILLRHMGHLAHEEKPQEVVAIVFAEAERYGILAKDEHPVEPQPAAE
ncbi:alpha/beta fold hydrolase [Rhodomicrobium vannielii ATCC 17100]|uniref:alpha/beta fold hydrolase BchO n=1 Tax=Rhodomicrobium vannielii TaxID=1069 RepID=UPI0019182B73|nr:alpha/beta fold hydrolase BchO [Rhodomicrobium vannielii]MBJ7533334.1 alpha/beta fold hydrolase [Rhodomicrobium vannielii ATCC 17100]